MFGPKGYGFSAVSVTGMEFAHFALELGMVLSRELRECSNVLVVSIPDE